MCTVYTFFCHETIVQRTALSAASIEIMYNFFFYLPDLRYQLSVHVEVRCNEALVHLKIYEKIVR